VALTQNESWTRASKASTVTHSQQVGNRDKTPFSFGLFRALSIYQVLHRQVQEWWLMSGKGFGRKWSWPNRRLIPAFTYVEENQDNSSQHSRFPFREPNPAPTKHKCTAHCHSNLLVLRSNLYRRVVQRRSQLLSFYSVGVNDWMMLTGENWSKGKTIPVTGGGRPWGFVEFEVPRFQDNRHMKVVRLSALHTSRLYPPRKLSWYSFLLKAESTPGP
jgi:hypothetical protein